MNPDSRINPELLQAYLECDYYVFSEPGFKLKIAERSPELIRVFQKFQYKHAVYLTACNPHSVLCSIEKNQRATQQLSANLSNKHYTFLKGVSRDKQGKWPDEVSFLVFDMPFAEAKMLAKTLRQNAIVWIGETCIPELILFS